MPKKASLVAIVVVAIVADKTSHMVVVVVRVMEMIIHSLMIFQMALDPG